MHGSRMPPALSAGRALDDAHRPWQANVWGSGCCRTRHIRRSHATRPVSTQWEAGKPNDWHDNLGSEGRRGDSVSTRRIVDQGLGHTRTPLSQGLPCGMAEAPTTGKGFFTWCKRKRCLLPRLSGCTRCHSPVSLAPATTCGHTANRSVGPSPSAPGVPSGFRCCLHPFPGGLCSGDSEGALTLCLSVCRLLHSLVSCFPWRLVRGLALAG